ncbi:MAG: carboxypeptidase regulatory-like domain-containing protein [Bryobacterales bacterium]|nr:carboxypeptidase regulatory-like domain-containing protein [Bryobacterales bacterium]
MTTEYASPIPGTLFDFDLRGTDNDQLTAFRPADQKGDLSFVRKVDGANAIEAVRSAPLGDGLAVRHEYRLEPGSRVLRITTTWKNEGPSSREITPRAVWKGLDGEVQAGEIRVADSIDPADKRGFAWAPVEPRSLPETMSLASGEPKTVAIAVAVGESPLAAYGEIAALLGKTGEVSGSILDADKAPAINGALIAKIDGADLRGYPGADGRYAFRLPAGAHTLRFEDIGRDSTESNVQIAAGKSVSKDWAVSKASRVQGTIKDIGGMPSPGKIQFIGRNGTKTPDLGTIYRVHGNSHQYQTHDGTFDQQLPPGDYLVRITLGPEYDLAEQEITVKPAETVEVNAVLRRTVDTAGWVSTDFHAHSTPSGDNYCNTRDRLINFAAEHIEFAPTTEHNRIYDWEPLIGRLGLASRIKTVPGIELTGSGQHFNSFPLVPDPLAQNGGAPLWTFDPRITAINLRNWGTPSLHGGSRYDSEANARNARDAAFGGGPDRWVQANHPEVQKVFFDRDENGVRDGGFEGFEKLIDAAEVWSSEILDLQPVVKRMDIDREWPNRTFFWLQMLNQGRHVWCVSVSDAHRIFGNGVGNWRTYVPSSTDEPAAIDHQEIIRNAKAGRMMITNGPFLEVTAADGLPIGSAIQGQQYVDLKIRVQAPNWIDIDRVQVLVNGRQPEELNFTAKKTPGKFRDGVIRFDETVRVTLEEDAHLIVVATDEDSTLEKGWGLNPQGKMRPTAYTNPIYVDVAHDGFQANGDTLGHPLPSSKL